jgi:hypothetical protein
MHMVSYTPLPVSSAPAVSRIAAPAAAATVLHQSQYAARMERLLRVVQGDAAPSVDTPVTPAALSPTRPAVSAAQAPWSRLSDHACSVGRAVLDEKVARTQMPDERKLSVIDMTICAFVDAGTKAQRKGARPDVALPKPAETCRGAATLFYEQARSGDTRSASAAAPSASVCPSGSDAAGPGPNTSIGGAPAAVERSSIYSAEKMTGVGAQPAASSRRREATSSKLRAEAKLRAEQARQKNAYAVITRGFAKRTSELERSAAGEYGLRVFDQAKAESKASELVGAGAGAPSFGGASGQGIGLMAIGTANSGIVRHDGVRRMDDSDHRIQTFVSSAILATFLALCILCGERFAELLQFATSNNGMFM